MKALFPELLINLWVCDVFKSRGLYKICCRWLREYSTETYKAGLVKNTAITEKRDVVGDLMALLALLDSKLATVRQA